jgi:S1-C subfamily serine protease
LHVDDVIVAIDGRRVETVSALVTVLRTHRPGDKVALDYVRAGSKATMVVTLAERPE